MKRLTLLLVILMSGSLLFGQQARFSGGDGKAMANRDFVFQCYDNSVFSQFDATFDDGYYCDVSYAWTKVADDYVATAPFSAMRLWGFDLYGCAPGTSETYTIEFYNGNPSSGGVLVNTFTKTITPLPVGVFVPWGGSSTEMYQIDIEFGTEVTLLNGWVSVSRVVSTDGCNFAWTANDNIGNGMSYGYGSWQVTSAKLFFCFGSTFEVPISTWALVIGIALIAVTAFVRFRRIS